MANGFLYEQKHFSYLKENIHLYAWKELSAMFNAHFGTNIRFEALRQAANKRGIKRPPEAQHFQKGMHPWNKGVKGYMGANVTSFRKGEQPINTMPLGTERKMNREGLVEVKVKMNGKRSEMWKYRSHLVLQDAGISVPRGYVAFHKNGIPDDDRLENLEVIPRSILSRIGHCSKVYKVPYKQLPPELQEVVLAKAKLTVKYKALQKQRERGQQNNDNPNR